MYWDYLLYFVITVAILFKGASFFKVEVHGLKVNETKANIHFVGYQDETKKSEAEVLKGKTTREIFNYYVKNQKYIMHAGGAIDGHIYTNSLEALEENYKKGNRIFEIDLNYTNDHQLVMIHGWTESDYQGKLGVPYAGVMNKATFKNTLLHGKYHTMTLEDLIKFMRSHPYAYFILNLKGGSKAAVSKDALTELVNLANRNPNILDRLVIWGYNLNVIKTARRIYNFDLITLSYNDPKDMPTEVNTKEKMIAYCVKNNISSLIFAEDTFDEEIATLGKKAGIYSFVFTIDNEKKAQGFLDKNATMILSNHLLN